MKGLLLVSEGIDSPVAGYMISRKMDIDAIHFINGSDKNIPFVKELLHILTKHTKKPITLFLIDHTKNQEIFKRNCHLDMQCILCKRLMHKISAKVAEDKDYDFLINGENLGQVASQTVSNMKTIHNGLSIPVLQPLLAIDKKETIAIAQKIGTYDSSIKNTLPCPYVPKHPKTRSYEDIIEKQEQRANISELIKISIASMIEITIE
jgi:tRNA uracil 4-sulfurtransferase